MAHTETKRAYQRQGPTVAVMTKSIFEPKETGDGYRILITRFYPRGVQRSHFDEWIRPLSPRPELLFACKKGKISWDSFRDSFMSQLKSDVNASEAILFLHDWSRTHDVTLLCFEKSGRPCHRHIVRDVIDNPRLLGLEYGTKNTDNITQQPPLFSVINTGTCFSPIFHPERLITCEGTMETTDRTLRTPGEKNDCPHESQNHNPHVTITGPIDQHEGVLSIRGFRRRYMKALAVEDDKFLRAKRLVIDSLSAMTTYIKTRAEARTFVAIMNRFLENAKCTTLCLHRATLEQERDRDGL